MFFCCPICIVLKYYVTFSGREHSRIRSAAMRGVMEKRKIDFIVNDMGIKDANARVKKAFRSGNGAASAGSGAKPGMTGASRAAKLLLALGPQQAGNILRELDIADIEKLVNEMAQIKKLSAEEKNEILAQFNKTLEEFDPSLRGGPDKAREILTSALGSDKARDILSKMDRQDLIKDFEFLEQIDPHLLATALAAEHPQVAAVALSCIKPKVAAMVMKQFEPEFRSQTAIRIARTSRTHPEAVQRVARVLREKFEKRTDEMYSETGGAEALANILNHMDRQTEEGLLGKLDKEAPDVFENVKGLLYTFEELLNLETREMRLLLSNVNDDFIVAASLRGAGDDLRRHFFNSLSQNRAADVLEEMDHRGPISVREINEARTYILNIARKLDEEGTIVIKKEREDYV